MSYIDDIEQMIGGKAQQAKASFDHAMGKHAQGTAGQFGGKIKEKVAKAKMDMRRG